MEGVTYDINFGKLAAKMGRERKVLENGILPSANVTERSQVVTGLIDGLIEQGKWRDVVRIMYNENDRTAQMFYDGDEETFDERIVTAVKSDDIFTDRDGDLEDDIFRLLGKNGKERIIFNIGTLTEGLSHNKANQLIWKAYNFSEEGSGTVSKDEYNIARINLAQSVQESEPDFALQVFTDHKFQEGIEQLYDSHMKKFSLDNVDFLIDTAKGFKFLPFLGYREKVKEVVVKALHTKGKEECEGLGKTLYSLVANEHISLKHRDQMALERLAVLHLSDHDVTYRYDGSFPSRVIETPYTNLRLRWAHTHWKEHPIKAYEIFKEKGHSSKKVIQTAKKAFIGYHNKSYDERKNDSFSFGSFRQEDVEQFYKSLPKGNLDLRTTATRMVKDKEELAVLSAAYQKKGDAKEAYDLRIESSKAFNEDEQFITKVVDKRIDDDIADEIKNKWGGRFLNFHWISKDDSISYEHAYDKTVEEFPAAAFRLAKGKEDQPRVHQARKKMFKVNDNYGALLEFFREHQDPQGYQGALRKLSQEYGTTPASVEKLLGGFEKKKE